MKASELLQVDHDAALAKLAWSQLQGTWQLPAELARLALAAGASSVEIEITPRRLALQAPGARLERPAVGAFATVLDRDQEASERHQAMVELEELDAFALAAVACLDVKLLELKVGGEGGLRVDLRRGGELAIANPGASQVIAGDLELVVEGPAIEAERAAEWLRRVARFAAVPITVNGDPIEAGFDEPLIRGRLGAPLPITLAIPRRGNTPRLWLLRHGILSTRATVPGFPAFEAAVEMASLAGPTDSAAMLREKLGPHVEALVHAAVGLTIRLAQGAEDLGEETRARTARLLLEAALKKRRGGEVSSVEIFPLAGPDGRRLVHLDEIRRRIRVEKGGACALDAIPPGRDPREFSLAGRPALVISQAERVLLGELLQVVFSAPPAPIRRSLAQRLTDLAAGRADFGLGRGTALTESELSEDEIDFLDRVRTALADEEGTTPAVEMRDGLRRPRRTADGTVLVPRNDPTVQAAVRAVGHDPAWLYPAVAFLLGGRELPSADVKRQWSARRQSAV